MRLPMLAAAATTLALSATAPAEAALSFYDEISQPAALCQPAREYPDLRIREVEIDNIGTTNAYVVCAPPGFVAGGATTLVNINFANAGAVDQVVRCTVRVGFLGSIYETTRHDVNVFAGSTGGTALSLGPDDGNLDYLGIQCILPPDVSMGQIYREYSMEDQT